MSQSTNQQGGMMNVFDRQAKKMQKDRTALAGDYQTYNYIKDEVLYTQ